MKAVEKLKQEMGASEDDYPDPKNIEYWRGWWLNEAEHACTTNDPIGRVGEHLSGVAQASFHVLLVGAELRDALETNKAEKAAALAILLICEIMQGGLLMVYEKAHASQKKAYAKGFGSDSKDITALKAALLRFAEEEWASNPKRRIGEMVDAFGIKARTQSAEFKRLRAFPKPDTMKAWIRASDIAIPEAAQKRGRPHKTIN